VNLAAEKSRQARRRVLEAINELQRDGPTVNFNTICQPLVFRRRSFTIPNIRILRNRFAHSVNPNSQSSTSNRTNSSKSDSAKDAQIARCKERITALEEQLRALREENELLYGKLSKRQP
jgi:hypothetical protein